ncbi:hypothetical protein THAOC_14180, partial [Thalassiosira oceanica]
MAKIGSQPRRYRRIPSPSTQGGRPDSLDSGGSGHGLRTFRATLHPGEKDRESRLAHQAGTHHEVDSRLTFFLCDLLRHASGVRGDDGVYHAQLSALYTPTGPLGGSVAS